MKKNIKNTLKLNKNYIVIIFCLAIILPIIILGFYNSPSADDYDYAILTHNAIKNGGNIFELIKAAHNTNIKFYNEWQGLYSSAFILSLQPGIFGENFYFLTTIIILIIAFICLFISFNILNKYYIKKEKSFVFMTSMVVLTIVILLLPSATQGLYWYNGAMNYMPWAFTNLLQICLIVDMYYSKDKKLVLLLIISSLLGFITSGGNHVTSFANILFLLYATIYLMFKKKKYYSLIPLFLSIIGFVIMYKAPGTAIRQSRFQNPSIQKAILETYRFTKVTFISWIDFKWLLTIIIITPIAILMLKNSKIKFSRQQIIISLILSYIVIFSMFCIPYYAMSDFGEPRLKNVVWITFVFLSWYNYLSIFNYIFKNKIKKINFKIENSYFIIITIIFLIFLLPGKPGEVNKYSNSYVAIGELRFGVAKDYANQMRSRIKLYNGKKKIVQVDKIRTTSILFFRDVTDNPDVWPNTSLRNYYNKTIYLKN